MRLVHQRGIMMLEVILMLVVSASALLIYNRLQVGRQIEEANVNAAKHAQIIQAGVNKLINDNRKALLTEAAPAIAGLGNVFEPTVTELQASPVGNPYVPEGYDAANRLGMQYLIRLTRLPAGCTPAVNCTDVTGVIYSTAPLIDDTTGLPDGARVGNIASKIGIDAASSKVGSGTVLTGAGGTWGIPNPLGNQEAVLVMRVGYGSVLYNSLDFLLPRDGSRPMTGNLAMNGNNIEGAAAINATGTITTTTGEIRALDGKVVARYLVPTAQTVGAACTDPRSIASTADGVILVCRNGTWQVQTGHMSSLGAACAPDGTLATSVTTGEALICRGGAYVRLANAVGKYVEVSRQAVMDGTTVAQPVCDPGGVPTFRFGIVQTAVDVSTAPPKQVTMLTAAVSGGSNWQVSYKLKDDSGTITSGNLYNLQAIMYLECKYP